MRATQSDEGYQPIAEYAVIGNLRSTALIARNGSLDWCCLPHLDSPSVFGALLDRHRGGSFRVRPSASTGLGVQQYIEGTNVLRTILDGERGTRLVMTDYMPLHGALDRPADVEAPPEIHRVVSCDRGGGPLAVEVVWAPRPDYGRARTRMWSEGERILAEGGSSLLTLEGLPQKSFQLVEGDHGPVLRARFDVRPGAPRVLVTRYGEPPAGKLEEDRLLEMFEDTVRAWRGWVHVCDPVETCAFSGRLHSAAVRSALTLKLLTYGATGAIAASPTTSLPERIGGVRNWDYRFTWVRDASLISQSLFGMGHRREARDFLRWLEDVASTKDERGYDLQIMYGLRGERELPEREVPELEGYRGSRPVRVGNAAARQLQLDMYGELLNAGFELSRIGGELTPEVRAFLVHLADESCRLWTKPDHGFWEVRTPPRHFVSSKIMLWCGLDRAVRMAERSGLPGDVERWRHAREAIREAVLTEGFDEESGTFVRVFGSKELDASNLLIPIIEFLPADDPRVQGTIDRTLERLCENGLVRRYLAEDGLPGGEGAFVLCTFWLVNALALSGRTGEARNVFDTIFRLRNHAGLLPEEINPHTGEFLGNFPQAFSHSGLINSALYLAEAEGRTFRRGASLIGSVRHRQETIEGPVRHDGAR